MEHGFGGMFMIRIMIVFVFIYVMFIGIALNIAKAYRIKNGVLNILEQYSFNMENDSTNVLPTHSSDGHLKEYLDKIPYVAGDGVRDHCEGENDKLEDAFDWDSSTGVCILQIGNKNKYHYKVYVYMTVNFPLFGLNDLLIPVSGETVTMEPY